MRTRLDGKVAFITGAARGQGRSHAIRLAEEGADIIAVDICKQIESVRYPLANPEDLQETVRAVEGIGCHIYAAEADVRDPDALQAAVDAGTSQLGAIDIVIANAGIAPLSLTPTARDWFDVIDVNLTGVYHTVEAAIPSMIERGTGGSVVLISSTAGLAGLGGGMPAGLGYSASKHGVVGLMQTYANVLAPQSIRVNSIHPTGVNTPMVVNDVMQEFLQHDSRMGQSMSNALPIPMLEPDDISNAVLWLVSDSARGVTGVALPVDAGFLVKI